MSKEAARRPPLALPRGRDDDDSRTGVLPDHYRNGDVMYLNPPVPLGAAACSTDASTSTTPVAATEVHPVRATLTLLPLMADPESPRYAWTTKLLANAAAGPNARLRVRPRLTVARWTGNVDAAGQVSDKLVHNAAHHGKPFSDGCIDLRLTVLAETEELRIEVADAEPAFPDFETATSTPPKGSGLWWVQHYGGRLSWDVKVDDSGRVVGKTVTAVLAGVDEREPA
ncbi:hypothetical protein [Streptomyces sp. NPDC053367]|uniref:hypothetical protein n=1 Tax=Streptomyces sp. NPDC053367 TaxID=3365700 RepID=UPI0037D1AA63